MIKRITVLLLLMIGIDLGAVIQKPEKRFSFLWYPLSMVMGRYSFETELVLSEHITLAGEYTYWDLDSGDWEITGSTFGPGIRYYFNYAPNWYFLGFYTTYQTMNAQYSYTTVNYQDAEIKAEGKGAVVTLWFGRRWLMGPFAAELATGFRYSYLKSDSVEFINSKGYKQKETYKENLFGFAGLSMGMGISF